jgi:hypothetical protein
MKHCLILLSALTFVFASCEKSSLAPEITEKGAAENEVTLNCVTARLEKIERCGQRIVSILSEDKTGLNYAPNWTHPVTKESYQNVFAVGNICDFPSSIKENETFKFVRVEKGTNGCVTCLILAPTPAEKMNIKIGCSSN